MATQYDPIAKDESLNTTELSPRNIADVLAEELDAIAQAIGGGGGSGGHTIISPDGTSMPQRAGLSFTDSHISDDAVNDETVVEIVEGISKTDWDNLDPTDPSNNGLYEISMPNNTPILDASMVAYGNGTVKDALDSSSVKYIEVTLPSSGNTTPLTLPTGFTTNNCIPFMCQRHYNEEYFISDSASASVYYSGTSAFLWFKDAYRGSDFRIYFMRYI